MSDTLPQDPNAVAEAEAAAETELSSAPSDVTLEDMLRRQRAIVAMGRRTIAPPDLSILVKDAAKLIAEILGTEHNAIAKPSSDGKKITQVLALGASDLVQPRTVVQEAGRCGQDSLMGYALEVAHLVQTVDLAREDRFSDHFLRKHGIKSGIAVPLKLAESEYGVIAACTSREREFGKQDELFVETVAHLITTSAARTKAERLLAQERRISREVLRTVRSLVLVLDGQGRIISANRACEEITGFGSDEIKDRPIGNVFPAPEEVSLFQDIFQKLRDGVSPVEYESILLTKHSDRRQISWSYAAMLGPEGEIESVVATGIDVTQQRQAEEEVRKIRESIENDSPVTVISERRGRPRRPYQCSQSMAPILGEGLPAPEDFVEIECHDISSGGFSFVSSFPPQCDSLVVALGSPDSPTYLTAQVAHVRRMERHGESLYLIGCSYFGRVRY